MSISTLTGLDVEQLSSEESDNGWCFVLFVQMQNELLEAMKAETFYEGDNRLADTDLTVAEMMERETKRQEECDKNKNSLMTDFEGLPIFAVSIQKIILLVFILY